MADFPKIWLSSPHLGSSELRFVQEAFETNWAASKGPNVDGFEADLASYCQAGYAAALSSGTAAIHLALVVLGIQPGDEVICQSFTFSASANPIRYLGATPVFVDSEPETWNMDPVLLEEAITDRIKKGTKPKAILPVHLYGMPAKMPEIMEISQKYEIPVIEDAAEALGSSLNGKPCGSFGKIGILSFNGNKIITTSGGGALLSKDEELVKKARFLSTQARDAAPWYQHTEIGYNYRMSNVAAGIGRGQMQVINDRVEKRRANFAYYKKELSAAVDGIAFLYEPTGFSSNRWLTTILIHPEKNKGKTWRDVFEYGKTKNIETRPLWKPMHLQPVFAGFPKYETGISESLFNVGLCLPSGSNLTTDELDRVIEMLVETLS